MFLINKKIFLKLADFMSLCFFSFLLFLMLFFPTIYSEFKLKIISIILLLFFLKFLFDEIFISKKLILLASLITIYGSFNIILSIYYGNYNLKELTPLYVIYPFLLIIISSIISNIKHVLNVIYLLLFFSTIVNLYQFWYFLHILKYLNYFFYFPLNYRSSIKDGIYSFFGDNTAQNYFMFPLMSSILIFSIVYKTEFIKLKFLIPIFILQLTTLILIGQRSSFLVILLTFIILFAIIIFKYKSLLFKFFYNTKFIILLVFTIFSLYYFKFHSYLENLFLLKISQNPNNSSGDRVYQIFQLLAWWSEKPILGWGLGNYDINMMRDMITPWAYEAYFIYLLGATGILGLVIYATAFFSIIFLLLKNNSNPEGNLERKFSTASISVSVALLAFLGPCFFNPYLPKFDTLWIFLVAFIIINIKEK